MKYLLTVAVLLSFSIVSKASHIVGVDLYYTWISGNDYKITCNLYGDCGSAASTTSFSTLDSAAPVICIYDGSTFIANLSLAIEAPVNGVEITPVCPDSVGHTQCNNLASATPGIKKFVYSGIYTLPNPSHLWRFVYTGDNGPVSAASGRAAAITNISGAGATLIEVEDTLDNIVGNNSNPILTVVPTPFFCLNNNDGYSPGAIDADNDSLVFSLVDGQNGNSTMCASGGPLNYIGGRSGADPLSYNPGTFALDIHTGQIVFFPNVLQRSLVVYNVREYRGGVFIGSCQREMTFLVVACTRTPPSGNFGSTSQGHVIDGTHFEICAETEIFSLDIIPEEIIKSNSITIKAAGIPASSSLVITDNGTPTAHALFTWNTIGLTPGDYPFYITYTDNGCPLPGSQTVAYLIRILPPMNLVASPHITHVNYGGKVQLNSVTTSPDQLIYRWDPLDGTLQNPNINNPVANPLVTTKYTVYAKNPWGCRAEDTALVIVDPTTYDFVPTSFTPNGDGKNDIFRIVNMHSQRLIEFSVYNRWGKTLFETTDKTKGWDGTYNGQAQEIGVYYYHIIIEEPDGTTKNLRGDVTLIR